LQIAGELLFVRFRRMRGYVASEVKLMPTSA
jgi:hypothetical protein